MALIDRFMVEFQAQAQGGASTALLSLMVYVFDQVNQDMAAELVAIGELFAHRSVAGAESGQWAIDTFKAVAGEVAAGQKIMPCVSRFEGKTLVIDR